MLPQREEFDWFRDGIPAVVGCGIGLLVFHQVILPAMVALGLW